MVLRRAKISDLKLFFILRNQSQPKLYSESKKKINYKGHKYWYLLNYNKKNNFFFVITFKTKDAGYLRVEKRQKYYDVSICVRRQYRRLNIAYKSLMNLSKKIKKKITLRAIVNLKNISSIRLFIKSGFKITQISKNNFIMFKKI
tara:strand:- start:206 stop:640 length:435 start_codon:yes stop_codon:yes gene_type:complete